MSSSSKPVTRVSIYAKRRPDLTPEQFYEYWEKVHAPLTAPWLVKYKVVAYSQIHCPKPSFRPDSDGTLPPPFEYDGISQFDIGDMKTFSEGFKDPYYINVIKADEVNFLDTNAKLIRTIGELKSIVGDGKAVVDVHKEQAFFDSYGKEEKK